jgi:hypothetical protein
MSGATSFGERGADRLAKPLQLAGMTGLTAVLIAWCVVLTLLCLGRGESFELVQLIQRLATTR